MSVIYFSLFANVITYLDGINIERCSRDFCRSPCKNEQMRVGFLDDSGTATSCFKCNILYKFVILKDLS